MERGEESVRAARDDERCPRRRCAALLSHALYATWHEGQGRCLTIANYHQVGGIDGAVAASASAVYDQLTAHQRQLARSLFLSLVHVAADTRRRVTTAQLFADYREDQLDDVADVRSWLDSDRAGLVIGRRLTEAATTWQHENRDTTALYRGPRLAAAQEWVDAGTPDLSPLARDFLDTSIRHEHNERHLARRHTASAPSRSLPTDALSPPAATT